MEKRELPMTPWQEAWFDRTLPELQCETLMVVFILASISLFTGIRALIGVRRSRKELEASPSDRAAILSECDKKMHKSTKTIFTIATVYLFHSLALWLADAAIGVTYIYKDVNANPEDYDAFYWLQLAIQCVSMLALFMAVFIIFPMLQLMGVAHMVKKAARKNSDGTLSAYIPEGRTLTTHLAQLWFMLGFFVVAYWPVFSMSVLRLVVLEAVFGSGLAWLNASFLFNFRSEVLCKFDFSSPACMSDRVKLYGKNVTAAYTEKSELLPKYQDEAEQNEKTGL